MKPFKFTEYQVAFYGDQLKQSARALKWPIGTFFVSLVATTAPAWQNLIPLDIPPVLIQYAGAAGIFCSVVSLGIHTIKLTGIGSKAGDLTVNDNPRIIETEWRE